MDVFRMRSRLVEDYASYTRSFIKIADPRIHARVETALDDGIFWPEPLLQLNPTFQPGGTIDSLVEQQVLHPECQRIFRVEKTDTDHTGRPLMLHTHQAEAIRKAKDKRSYILTSGTGSGKSLTYIVPIVDHVLRQGSGGGIKAIVVYPMNALANSQQEELAKFLSRGYPEGRSPVTFARYTGQEKTEEREAIRANPPDILLTNYMMLELLLTRSEDRELVRAAQGLQYLVFDELHTYRGRQGADVALLIRRCRLAFGARDLICVGTSATMASAGTSEDQKRAVARVAETLFGTSIDPAQVIGETLERSTPEIDFHDPAVIARLRDAVTSPQPPPDDYEAFRQHPLASWIESTFGIRTEAATSRLIRQAPRTLRGHESAGAELARLTGTTDESRCADVIQSFLLHGANLFRSPSSKFPIFAFRLHQFFTRGDTVWTTLEPEDIRHLEMSKLGAKPGEPDKPLFPLMFCRHCGAAYYRVSVLDEARGRFLGPREDRREEGDDGSRDAFLYLSSQAPWPRTDGAELLERLPSNFKQTDKHGVERLVPEARADLPEIVFVTPRGDLVSEGEGIEAALIPRRFLFCLNPECGVVHDRSQRSEWGKLATLGVDSRSTATTILAVRSLIELQGDQTLDRRARKLLSFTDNRQDASLQAGHFNDFTQVALLRSALYHAAVAKGPEGLSHAELSRNVAAALQLDFAEYAADSQVRGPARDTTNDALRRVIDYYLYRDLQRGWRVSAPNLEDCGLLQFEYVGLTGPDGLLTAADVWDEGIAIRGERNQEEFLPTPPALQTCTPEQREQILRTLLDVLRRGLAVKVDVLDPQRQLDLVEQTNPRLREGTIWYLEDSGELVKAMVAYPRPKQRYEVGLSISSYGGFGKYLGRTLREANPDGHRVRREDLDKVIRFLFYSLKLYGIIEQVRSDTECFQINHAALRWIAGAGEVRPIDRTRLISAGEIPPRVNQYFVDCYKRFIDLKCVLEAREHTAQVSSGEREEREGLFREARLPLLFCSPTMELGVDIAQLNVVNLRNVPPTPANYAQRSGRAGRGGQPALVYTYCAGRSPHDQYYFRQPTNMVAGSVAPPNIDLRNRELLRSHLHAIWLEVAKPDLGKTLNAVLDIQEQDERLQLPIKPTLRETLTNPATRAAALDKANAFINSIAPQLAGAGWFTPNWTREVFEQIERSFDRACGRWRELYRSAVRQRELHHRIIGDHSRPEIERNHSRRLRSQAETQIRLLTEAEGIYEGDFYSYRYFAAEGFLPGYNFPRLPISAFVPARRQRRGRDEFVSRPRFLAISEFGPRALIYHEGSRYRVYKVNLDFGSDDPENQRTLVTRTLKRCLKCGYAHLEQGRNLSEVCDRCQAPLDDNAIIPNLVQMQNVSLKPAERITCDEEERRRIGYRLATAYRFPEVGGTLDRRDAEVFVDSRRVLELSYGDSTELYRINLGWAHQRNQPAGFFLDLERGYWQRDQSDDTDREDASAGNQQQVVPYVNDTKNALVMRFHVNQDAALRAGLQAAFKEAIQKHFQLESRELVCEAMPDPRNRQEILFYESSEGGAGVLRQLVEDPAVIPALARRALEICHFDPDTLADLRADTCGKACYECLLDYFNQADHPLLNRYELVTTLAELARAECRPAGGTGTRDDRLAELRRRCDSTLEQKWLDHIERHRLRPPSDAQFLIEHCSTRPDFYYRDHHAAIYIDGPVHDQPDQRRTDAEIDERLSMAGSSVIRFHHAADWPSIFRQHPDIFGASQA